MTYNQVNIFQLLHDPLKNKDTAFSLEERATYGLFGLLPDSIETIDEQLIRVRDAIAKKDTDLEKHIYLRALQDRNEVLFYRFVVENITEMLPIIYTPVVGDACENFHNIYRQPRGLFLSYPNRKYIHQVLKHIASERTIKVIVVTDGERILGLGDQGAGGLGIPIGKLSLYTALGGIHPKHTLPIVLDVGTNNISRLEDIQYLGWRHERITGVQYDNFLDDFIDAVKKYFPNVLLQFEDFAQNNAYPLLEKNREKLCTFNDDIQGTASVVVAAVLSAIQSSGIDIHEHKIAVFGAGSAGCGISNQLMHALMLNGLSANQAKKAFYLIDRYGLLHDGLQNILPFQKNFLRKYSDLKLWADKTEYYLQDVINYAKPTVLIGVSGQPQQFTKEIVTTMLKYCKRPIIFPLSNPTSRCEASPSDLISWSRGQAIVATGSPYSDVEYQGKTYKISQANNAYIFPGIGLAVIAGQITRITDEMMLSAAITLSELVKELNVDNTRILPELSQIRLVSEKIAIAVINEAINQGFSKLKPSEIANKVKQNIWFPDYDTMLHKVSE